jgi:hypothetical protein
VEIERAQPPEVIFTTATAVGSTDTKDGTQTVEIENIGNEALDLTALSYPTDFPQAGGAAIPCTGSISLSAGEACDLPIEFAPTSLGPSLSEDVMLTDNEFNGTGVKQSIVVEGMTGSTPHTLYIPAPGTVLKGPEVTFVWSDTAGAVSYSLWIGSKGVGSSNVYDSGAISATTVKIGGLPTNGETLHGRVNAIFSKGSAHSDFTYPAATQAAITAPGAGTTLAGPSVTFTWSAATGASGYSLWLGSTGPGSHDLYVSHETTGTSANATGLPVNGETIYARLFTTYGNATVYSDSTFKAQ